MKDFTTTKDLRVPANSQEEALLFEILEVGANGRLQVQVQRKNENGCWGGRGDDVRFTCFHDVPNREKVIRSYTAAVERIEEGV